MLPEPSDMQWPPPKDWQDFERRMRDLFEAHWQAPAEMNGRTGQPQHGVDIYGVPHGATSYHGIQCKLHDANLGAALTGDELKAEIKKAKDFEPRIAHFIFVTTGPRDTKVQAVVRRLNARNRKPFPVQVMFWDDILALYNQHPDVFERHYGLQVPKFDALHQIRPPSRDFTGRKAELDELHKAIGEKGVNISGLQGLGGIGKTELAVKLVDELRDRYPDAQFFLDLKGTAPGSVGPPWPTWNADSASPVRKRPDAIDPPIRTVPMDIGIRRRPDPADHTAPVAAQPDSCPSRGIDAAPPSERPLTAAEALAQIIRCFCLPETKLPDGQQQLEALYQSALHGKKAIILADNARAADQVRPLIPPAGCLLLVTSRWHFTVPGLFALHLDSLPEADAFELLLKICPRIAAHTRQIADLCGRLPLALRAAASLLAVRPDIRVADYARDLSDERTRLERIGAEGVEITVEASLNLSYRLLDAETARVFRSLAVFPGTFDAAAEETICEDEGHKHLGELFRYSLVEYDESSRRWWLHDLARHFAAMRLRDTGDGYTTRLRHAQHHVGVLRAARSLYEAGHANVRRGFLLLDLERHNVETGQRWAAEHADKDQAAARAANDYPDAGAYVLKLRLHPLEWIKWLESGLASARTLHDKAAEGAHLGNLGNAYAALGQPHKAIEYHKQHLAIAREITDRRGEGAALGNLGNAYADLGEPRKAIQYYEQDLAIAREIGNHRGEGNALGNLGLAHAELSQLHKAIEYYEQHWAIAHKIGDRRGEGITLGNLGLAYAALGQPRKAIEYYEQQLTIAREIGDRRSEGNALGYLGNAYTDLGQPHKAIEYYEQDLAIARQIGDRGGEAAALGNLGLAYAHLGQLRKAIEYYEQDLAIAREIGDRYGEGATLGNLGIAYKDLGQPRRAIEYYGQALSIDRALGDRRGEGAALGNLGNAYAALREPRKAIEYHEQYLAIAREIGDRRGEAFVSWNMGLTYEQLGDSARAADLMQVCVDYEREIGHPDAEKHAARVATLRESLNRLSPPP